MNIHQTQAHADFLKSIGWDIEKKEQTYAFIRRIPLLPFALMKLQRVKYKHIDWDWVNRLEKKYHVYETDIELDETSTSPLTIHSGVESHGFHAAPDFMLNTKTRVLDLSLTEDVLLSAMKPKTRYNIHIAHREKLHIKYWSCEEVVSDSELFENTYKLLRDNAQRINMLLIPKEWIRRQYVAYGKNGYVIGVETQKDLLAIATFYCSQTTCSYNLNGSTADGRITMAPTLALWEGIRIAKQQGYSDFDFDGVFDERYPKTQKRFQGFGRFKSGFGGHEVYFYPMYKKFRRPF